MCETRNMPDPTGESSLLSIQVECYAGHKGEETPRVLHLGDRRVVITDVLDQWIAPDHRYFKLRGGDGHVYLVRHDVQSARWELTLFQRGSAPSDRVVE
jgi:hypothetical protein